jgi:hypothetical protein
MGRNCCWEAAGRDRAVKLGRVRAWRRSRHRDFDSRSSPMAGQRNQGDQLAARRGFGDLAGFAFTSLFFAVRPSPRSLAAIASRSRKSNKTSK